MKDLVEGHRGRSLQDGDPQDIVFGELLDVRGPHLYLVPKGKRLSASFKFGQNLPGNFLQRLENANSLEGDSLDDRLILVPKFGGEQVGPTDVLADHAGSARLMRGWGRQITQVSGDSQRMVMAFQLPVSVPLAGEESDNILPL